MYLFKDFFNSFFNISRYSSWSKERTGKVVGYYFFVVFIVSLLFTSVFFINYNPSLNEFRQDFKENAPNFSFQEGIFSFDHDGPYVIDTENNSALIIDTKAKSESDFDSVSKDFDSVVLVFSDRMVEKDGMQTTITNFSELNFISFDKQDVVDFLPLLKGITILMGILIFLATLAGFALVSVIVSALGLLIQKGFKLHFSFGQLFKCSLLALTPAFILEFILVLSPLNAHFQFIFAIPLLYLILMFAKQNQTPLDLTKS